MKHVTIDFETHPIVPGSPTSPRPVGVAIRMGGKSKYGAWGHPSGNNTTKPEAFALLEWLCAHTRLVMHNAQFDLRVLDEHFGLRPMNGFDDTKILAFLWSPNHRTLSLKPLADELLKLPPDEQDEMHDWLRQNYLPARRASNPTKYTAFAPGALAGKYARGDVDRTWKLYRKLYPIIRAWGMGEAYQRELAVVWPTIKMEQGGVRIDAERLADDLKKVKVIRSGLGGGLTRRLGQAGKDVNLNSRQQLANALHDNHMMVDDTFLLTDKGNESVSIPALRETCTDQKFVDDLELHSKLGKLIGTYMTPWLESAETNDGYFYPYFNPTRVDAESGGTRTGRYSSNFQQVPKEPFKGLPFMRRYVLPDEGQTLVDRDYSQQELRILAHFAGGELAAAYRADPMLDMHDHVQALMKPHVPGIQRKQVKTCNFLTVYGGGVNRLADQLGVPYDVAQDIREAHKSALPEVDQLNRRLRDQHQRDGFIRTWGGRKYALEYDQWYKLLNVLIQGSAADQTKEAIIRFDDQAEVGGANARLMVQVHDELVISAPGQGLKYSGTLKRAMETIPGWSVPMLTDVTYGASWGDAK